MHATCLFYLIIFGFLIRIMFAVGKNDDIVNKITRFSLAFPTFLLGSDMFLMTLLLSILSLCSSVNLKDQVSYPYKKQANLGSISYVITKRNIVVPTGTLTVIIWPFHSIDCDNIFSLNKISDSNSVTWFLS
jgi:hypothetical protein